MSDHDKTAYLIQLLREHHVTGRQGEWATFVELRGSTGFVNDQRIDFFAVHTWPSKRYQSIAYEVKVSRGDFLKEIRHPEKRRFAESVASKSYFVAPIGLIKSHEVPEGWGLMEPKRGTRSLRIIKHAEERTSVKWTQHFMMSMIRRAADTLPRQIDLFRQKSEASAEHEAASAEEIFELGQGILA